MPAARETVIGKFVNQILFKVDKSSIHHYAELCRAAQMKLKMAQEMVLSRHLGPQTSAGVQYRFDFVREEVVLLEATAN